MQVSPANSRRRFLSRAAAASVAAGGAWVAPSVMSVDVAGAQSCNRLANTLVWAGVGTQCNPAAAPSVCFPAVVNGVTISAATSSTGTPPGAGSFRTNTGTSGTWSPYYRLEWGNATSGSTQTITLTFSPTVRDVRFELTDMDGATNWRDTITLSHTGPGSRTVSELIRGANIQGTNPTWNGATSGDVGSGSTAGNLQLEITGQVTTLTLVYTAGPETGTSQHVGIYGLSFCP